MSTGSLCLVFTNVLYMLFLLFITQWIALYAGGQEDNVVFSAGSQPEFSFRQQGTARSSTARCYSVRVCLNTSHHRNHHITASQPQITARQSAEIILVNITYSLIANCQTAVVHKNKTRRRSIIYKSQYILQYSIVTVKLQSVNREMWSGSCLCEVYF